MIKEGCWIVNTISKYFIQATVSNGFVNSKDLPQGWSVWKPSDNEWCWFWNEGSNPNLRQFSSSASHNIKSLVTVEGEIYDFISPFNCNLPQDIIDKSNNKEY